MSNLHLVGYGASQANGSTLIKLPALADSYANIQNSNLVVDSKVNQILKAWGYGAHLSRLQLQAPSLQVPGYPDVRAVNQSVPSESIKPYVQDYRDNPFQLVPTEQLSLFAINGYTGAEYEWGFVLLSDGSPQPVKGKIFTLKLTGSNTLVADAWNIGVPLTFEDNLPAGKYSLVGARFESATAIMFRLGVAGFAYRPGGVAMQSAEAKEPEYQRMGALGEWFQFDNTVQLTADVLSTAADTSETVYVDVIKL